MAASERARLANLGRQRQLEFQLVLSDFAIERLLYRLGVSRHADRFVLKGARLFRIWSEEDRRRATWDLDLLGRGANGIEDVVADLREMCSIPAADGIVFDVGSIRGELIRAADEYAGVRIRFEAKLDGARIPMQVDVGFGDAVTPRRETYPTLLDHDPPTILAYPREAVVAEKFEAMVSLGVTNSRVKDFHDVHTLASSFAFDGALLAAAIRATFERRGTPLPEEEPLVLSTAFLSAPERRTLWRAFLRRHRLDGPADAAALSDGLRLFLGPVLASVRDQTFAGTWPPGGPWQ
jgi:hypothetical protein